MSHEEHEHSRGQDHGHDSDREHEAHAHVHGAKRGGAHAHHHHAAPADFELAFAVGVGLNFAFVVAQVIYGFLADSLALLADAGHNFADVLGLVLAWWTARLSRRQPSKRHTYGFRRGTILAALANAVVLLIGVGGIAVEAIRRLIVPAEVDPGPIIWIAAAGILVNGGTALLFHRGRKEDLNIRGAFLHLAADAGVSLAVVLAGLAILYTGWSWLDPTAGLFVAVVITLGTWSLLRESLNLALDAVPVGIDPDAVRRYLGRQPGVIEVHDLHIWAMSTTETALTAHLVRPGNEANDRLLETMGHELRRDFGIGHATIQIETDAAAPCELAPMEVV